MRRLPTRALRGRASLVAIAASGWLALAVLAAHLRGEGAVEIGYLARWAGAVLLPLALAVPRPGLEIGATALLLNLVAWVVPPGPQRGAAFGALLVAGVAVGAARLLGRETFRGRLDLRLVPLAVAVQALFAAERLLRPAAPLLWTDLAPAAAAGLAVAALAGRYGAAALAGGALAAIALGGLGPPAAALLLLAAAAGTRSSGSPRLRAALLVAAPAVLLALLPRGEVAFLPALLPLALLAPAALWPPPGGARDLWAGGWLLAAAGAALVGSPAALAPALLLFALALVDAPVRLRLSGVWSAWLLGAAALAAGYPWLAGAPVERLLAALGSHQGAALPFQLLAAAAAVAGAAALAAAAAVWPAAASPRRLALGAALLAAALGFARPETPLLGPEPTILTAESPLWAAELDGPPPREVVVEVALAGSGGLASGASVARLELAQGGAVAAERPLLAGVDLADWAARRADVAAQMGPPPGTAWIAWLPPEATFFAQRYRIRWRLPPPPPASAGAAPAALRLHLEPGLPSELTLAVHRVGVRR